MIGEMKVGREILIGLPGEDSAQLHPTKIELVKENKIFFITFPIKNGKYIKLSKNEKYEVCIFIGTYILKYEVLVLQYVKIDGKPFIKIQVTNEGEKIQRRAYYRADLQKEFDFTIINEDENQMCINEDMIEAYSLDISGGGIRFVSDFELKLSSEIKIFYELEGDVIIADAKVLFLTKRVPETDKIKMGVYEYRCTFTSIDQGDKEKIVSLVFSRQRRNLGLI